MNFKLKSLLFDVTFLRYYSCLKVTNRFANYSHYPAQISRSTHFHKTTASSLNSLMSQRISTSPVILNKTEDAPSPSPPSRKEKLKQAVKDYGSTVIIFHVTISLASLGFFYVLVSSGVDMNSAMDYVGISYKFAGNAGTFVTAYAIHKLFAPVRMSITLGATPFIVRYLRLKGILKKPPT